MKMFNNTETIQLGEYIIIQRQKYTKMHKFTNADSVVVLGREKIELTGLLGQPYGATYKMQLKDTNSADHKAKRDKQRLLTLQLCNEADLRDLRAAVGVDTSGKDNRNILDNGESQILGSEDIEQLRETCNDSTKIIEKIVQNSKTFSHKTEYSQEKYLKKKEKKYFEFVQIHKPTLRLITEINFRQDAEKIMSLRPDILSQILSYAGICAYGNFLLYESGTQGLLPASFLNAFGRDTPANLVHMFPGNTPQRQAVYALNLPTDYMERCISVNIYSVLRAYYQNGSGAVEDESVEKEQKALAGSSNKLLDTDAVKEPCCGNEEIQEPIKKKLKRDENDEDGSSNSVEQVLPAKPKWELENERALKLMHEKFDALVIAAKEHPPPILRELLPLVKPSRPIVIYSQYKEILVDLYVDLKSNAKVTNLHLISNWMRMYQILPNRTHPEINMNNNSGYILYGYTIA